MYIVAYTIVALCLPQLIAAYFGTLFFCSRHLSFIWFAHWQVGTMSKKVCQTLNFVLLLTVVTSGLASSFHSYWSWNWWPAWLRYQTWNPTNGSTRETPGKCFCDCWWVGEPTHPQSTFSTSPEEETQDQQSVSWKGCGHASQVAHAYVSLGEYKQWVWVCRAGRCTGDGYQPAREYQDPKMQSQYIQS